jgi:hypothetical protein
MNAALAIPVSVSEGFFWCLVFECASEPSAGWHPAMSCMNNCGFVTGAQAASQPDFRVQCSLGCSSQQMVCKQRC